ncbi:MAG: type I DNA topoisomerase [Oscillospiraceae bacterium]|nr:type I DNA topoisomerase [Oscillospiraceae bacterium]
MAKTSLVIVESPAKAKTIGKYLGPSYQVKACMGHLRDLPKSTLGVDLENDFTPNYRPIKGKEEIISELKKAAKDSEYVYLATDPDREGEAISWHLKELLSINDEKARRVTFNEITKRVVNESIAAPREIDQSLVDAQQARRILDRIVGYQLSPLLWKKIRRGLSAGRVQSVATRMVCDREHEIAAFQPEEYWSLDVKVSTDGTERSSFLARYHGKDGKKKELNSEEDVASVISDVQQSSFSVKTVKRQDKQRSPSPPFTTSTLQQEASRKLSMTPRRTMAIAQQLYEGIDIAGEGTVGLITYMRTDSLRLSDDAQEAAKKFILGRYGEKYYPGAPRVFKTKAGAQDAHEAIRPSDVTLTPENIKQSLTAEQYRLYRLIWSRFVACQMSNAIYDSISVEVESAGHGFRASSSNLKFSGYTAVYEEGKDEEKEEKEAKLPELQEGQMLTCHGFEKDQHFTQPPARYTDASLIRAMEENGIGRPSTYAPTVSTIIDREYVIKEGKYLRSTPLGEVVNGLMCDKFADIVNTKFTAGMEQNLDDVEEGTKAWRDLLREFYDPFRQNLEQAEKDLEGIRLKVPDELSEEVCDVCGKQMVIKSGRFGRFLACPGYPECTFTKPLVVAMPGRCPKCGGRILKKTSRNGYAYYGCENNTNKEEEKRCEFMTWDVPVADDCPSCGQTMFKKSGKGFKKPFCINEQCENFTPEEKRGGYRKKAAAEATAEPDVQESSEKTTTAKSAAKKSTKAKKESAGKTKKESSTAAKAKKSTAGKTTKKSSKKADKETV